MNLLYQIPLDVQHSMLGLFIWYYMVLFWQVAFIVCMCVHWDYGWW